MATVKEFNLEDEDNQASGAEQLSTASTIMPQTGGAPGANMAPTQASEQKGSGRFQNLQKYLDANQGAGERLAGGISRSVGREADQFERQTQQKSDPISQNIQSEKDRLAQAAQMNQQIQSGQAQQVAQNQLDDFTQIRTGQNQLGQIRNLKDQYSQFAQQGLGQLDQTAQQAATEGGRFNLLRSAYGGDRPGSQYGLGQRRLDQLFLQAEGGGQLNQLQQDLSSQVGQARDQFGQKMDQFGQSVGTIDERTRQAQEEAMAALGQWEQPGAGGFGTLYEQLQQGVASRSAEADAAVERARQQLIAQGRAVTGKPGGQQQFIDADIARELGLSGSMNFYDMNLSDWANKIQRGGEFGMGDVATEQQRQELAALKQLAGRDPSEIVLNETGSTLLDQGFGDRFEKEARQAEKEYLDRFFDEQRYDGMSTGNINSLRDRVNFMTGGSGWTGGSLGGGGTFTGVGSDNPYSVQQLQALRDRALEVAPHRSGTLQQQLLGTADSMQNYINLINQIAQNRINIQPEFGVNVTGGDQMLGGGGHFSVMGG